MGAIFQCANMIVHEIAPRMQAQIGWISSQDSSTRRKRRRSAILERNDGTKSIKKHLSKDLPYKRSLYSMSNLIRMRQAGCDEVQRVDPLLRRMGQDRSGEFRGVLETPKLYYVKVAMLCMDPFYRSLRGFLLLIQKDFKRRQVDFRF